MAAAAWPTHVMQSSSEITTCACVCVNLSSVLSRQARAERHFCFGFVFLRCLVLLLLLLLLVFLRSCQVLLPFFHSFFFLVGGSSLLLSSSTCKRFYPQRSSGQAVVTGAVPSPPRCVPSFLSRIGFIIPTARRFSSNVANSRFRAFRSFFMQEKVSTSMCTR